MKIAVFLTKIKEIYHYGRFIKFSRIGKNQNVLIYGLPRGGTSLMAQLLCDCLNARLCWEPFYRYDKVKFGNLNPYSSISDSSLGLGWNPHIHNPNEQLNEYLGDLFNLKVRNIRYYRFTNNKSFADQKYTVFKFCFGNFMYKYLQEKFCFKSIILLRHPLAVANSSINFGKNYDWHKRNFLNWKYTETKWSHPFFKKYDDSYSLIISPITLLVYQTVTKYSYILNNMDATNSIVIYYEDILSCPQSVRYQLEKLIGKEINSSKFTESKNKPSFSSSEGHTLIDVEEQLSKWKKTISAEDQKRSLKIFKAFSFSHYGLGLSPIRN